MWSYMDEEHTDLPIEHVLMLKTTLGFRMYGVDGRSKVYLESETVHSIY